MIAQQATAESSLSSPPFTLFVVTGSHIAKHGVQYTQGHTHMVKNEDRGVEMARKLRVLVAFA